MVATNPPAISISNEINAATGIAVPVVDTTDPVATALSEVMIADDTAQADVTDWIKTNDSATGTNKLANAELNKRIMARFESVRQGYEHFLHNHPDNAHAYLAYGSFLNDIGEEDGARAQYENSRQLDPKNPAVWNNLANYYGEHGPVTNAFADYEQAIKLKPDEPVYYQNFATTVYLFRTDARQFYHLEEQQVFDKALGLYQQAMQLAPDNFVLATDYAESYYGIRPLRTNDALMAWTNAMKIAHTDDERQGVEIHMARVKLAAGFYDQAQAHLDAVTNAAYLELKRRLEKSLADHKNPPTNSIEAKATSVTTMTNSMVNPSNPLPVAPNISNASSNWLNAPLPAREPTPP